VESNNLLGLKRLISLNLLPTAHQISMDDLFAQAQGSIHPGGTEFESRACHQDRHRKCLQHQQLQVLS